MSGIGGLILGLNRRSQDRKSPKLMPLRLSAENLSTYIKPQLGE
jgi:hypothetical protein